MAQTLQTEERGGSASLLSRLGVALVLRRLRLRRPDEDAATDETEPTPGSEATSGQASPPGRQARTPRDFTWTDWKQIFGRTFREIGQDNISLVAAGVAFYALLALFPAIAAFVMIYGIFNDPVTIENHLDMASRFVPEEAFALIRDQVHQIAAGGPTTLGVATVASVLVSIWSAKAGVTALITGLNIVYDEDDERGFIKGLVVALALTALLIVLMLVAFVAVVAAPAVLAALPFGKLAEWIAHLLRWPLGLAAVIIAIGALYRWAPSRTDPKFTWFSWGAAVAALIWLIGSALFSFYVANFGSYNETYGSLGAVIALMMWFWLSAFIVLLGAELNAEMEHQTRQDTTTGPEKPMGQRGAHVADTLPEE